VDFGWANLSATCFECNAVTLIRNFGRGSRDLNCSKCFLRQHVGTHPQNLCLVFNQQSTRGSDIFSATGVKNVELSRVLAVRWRFCHAVLCSSFTATLVHKSLLSVPLRSPSRTTVLWSVRDGVKKLQGAAGAPTAAGKLCGVQATPQSHV
jgi:hypothetical protein